MATNTIDLSTNSRIYNTYASMTAQGAENGAVTDWIIGTPFILAACAWTGVSGAACNKAGAGAQFRVEYSLNGTSGWTPVTSGTAISYGTDAGKADNSTDGVQRLSDPSSGGCGSGFQASYYNTGDNTLPDAGTISVNTEQWLELYFSLDTDNAADGQIYYLRIYNVTASTEMGTLGATIRMHSSASPSSSPSASPSEGTPSEGTPSGSPSSSPSEGTPSEGTPSEGTPSASPSEGTPSEGTPSGSPSASPSEGTPSEGTPSGSPSGSPSEGTPSGSPSEGTPSGILGNNFSTDTDCIALYNFESGAMATDSQNSNDLTTCTLTAQTSPTPKQGSYSGYNDGSTLEAFALDTALQDDFPFSATTGGQTMSVCMWLYPTESSSGGYIFAKQSSGSGIILWFYDSYIEYDSNGASVRNSSTDDSITFGINRWLHVSFSVDGSSGYYRIRVWDDTAQAIVYNVSGTGTVPSINAGYWNLGDSGTEVQGYKDEVVVFKRVLTTIEMDAIRTATYDGPRVNDFSGDSSCVAVWNFDQGDFLTDTSQGGGNDLTNAGSVTQNTNASYICQGDASAQSTSASDSYLYRTDSNLTSDFPLKNGETFTGLTICTWFINNGGSGRYVWAKGDTSTGIYAAYSTANGFYFRSDGTYFLYTNVGHEPDNFTPTNLQKYHLSLSIDASGNWECRVWGETEGQVVFSLTGSTTAPSANTFSIGIGGLGSSNLQGFVDETVVFNRKISSTEMDDIRQGLYSLAGTPSASPSEGTPSGSPSEGTPSGSPSEGSPSATPSEGTPSASPSEGTPSGSPSEGTPSGSPSEGTPSASPSEGTPSASPSEGTPSGSPSEGTPSGSPSEGTPSASPSEGTPSGSPSEGTPSGSPSEGTPSASPSEGTPSASPSEGTASASPSEGTPSGSPSEGTASASPSEGTPSASPSEGTASASPSEGTPSGSPSEGTPSGSPSEGTPSGSPSEGTPSASPSEGTASASPSEGTPSGSPSSSPSEGTPSEGTPSASGHSPSGSPSEGTPSSTPSASPSEGTPSGSPSEGTASASPSEGTPSGSPSEGTASASPSEGTPSASPSEGTASASPSEGTPSGSPSEGTPSGSPSEGTPSGSPSEGTPSGSPSEGTASASPSEGTPSGSPSEGTASGSPSEGTPSGSPSEGTPSATPSGSPSASPSEGTASASPSEGTASASPSEGTPSGSPSGSPSASPSEGTSSASPSEGTASASPSEGTPSASPSEGTPSSSPSGAPGDEDTYYICTVTSGGDDTLHLYVDGVEVEADEVDTKTIKVENVILEAIPTANPHITGALWNNSGVVNISSG